jgi:hypothetical protein
VETESPQGPNPIGNAADDFLLDLAMAKKVPLITNETKKKGLRTKAQQQGHPVFTPQEFLDCNHVDTAANLADFLAAFEGLGEAWIWSHGSTKRAKNDLNNVLGQYRHIIVGEVADELDADATRKAWQHRSRRKPGVIDRCVAAVLE